VSRTPRRNNNPNQNRRPQQRRPAPPVDVWSKPEALPDMQPIAIAPEVGAVLRSLGDPPMVNASTAGEYFAEVVERAAAIAAALALSADVLDQGDDD
jgi:hypothetical protein